jgi:photosystem II stability/assembly factor-like uncharacterized protein
LSANENTVKHVDQIRTGTLPKAQLREYFCYMKQNKISLLFLLAIISLLSISGLISCTETEGDDSTAEPALYEGSIDGGLVWTFPEEIGDVYFYDTKVGDPDAVGFAIAKSGNVYKRIKGVYYWNWEKVGKTDNNYKSAIHALDQERIIVSIITPHEYILKSNDGGITWKEVYRVAEEDRYLNFTPTEFYFIDDQNGFCYSASSLNDTGNEKNKNHFILATNDGGDTWAKMQLQPYLPGATSPSFDLGIWNMTMVDDILFAMGTHLLYSKDKGATWTHIPTLGVVYGIGKRADGKYIIGELGKFHISASLEGPWEQILVEEGVFPPDIPSNKSNQFPLIQRFHVWGLNALATGVNATWVSYDGCLTWKRPEGEIVDPRTHNISYSEVDGVWYNTYTPGNTDRNTQFSRLELKSK